MARMKDYGMGLERRLEKMERRNRWVQIGLVGVCLSGFLLLVLACLFL